VTPATRVRSAYPDPIRSGYALLGGLCLPASRNFRPPPACNEGTGKVLDNMRRMVGVPSHTGE